MDNLFFYIFFFYFYLLFVCLYYYFYLVHVPFRASYRSEGEVGACDLILTLDVRSGYCSSVVYIWWACASCVCVCASMFGFWKRYGPVVGARSPVRGTPAVVRTPVASVYAFGARWVL